MADITHPIIPSAQNVKLAMDSILKTASETIDVSPFLDARGRLPFTSLLPMMQALPDADGASIRSVYKAMSAGLVGSFKSTDVTEIADYAEMKVSGNGNTNISIPNCKRIGKHAFYDCTLGADTNSFAEVEEVDEFGFKECTFAGYATFPKLVTIGSNAFSTARGDFSFPSATSIAEDAFGLEYYKSTTGHTLYGATTVRLQNLSKDFVTSMPGFPFGMKQYNYRDAGKWKTTERRIICANREIIVPEETETLPWP